MRPTQVRCRWIDHDWAVDRPVTKRGTSSPQQLAKSPFTVYPDAPYCRGNEQVSNSATPVCNTMVHFLGRFTECARWPIHCANIAWPRLFPGELPLRQLHETLPLAFPGRVDPAGHGSVLGSKIAALGWYG
jgi:hypothetical protein